MCSIVYYAPREKSIALPLAFYIYSIIFSHPRNESFEQNFIIKKKCILNKLLCAQNVCENNIETKFCMEKHF